MLTKNRFICLIRKYYQKPSYPFNIHHSSNHPSIFVQLFHTFCFISPLFSSLLPNQPYDSKITTYKSHLKSLKQSSTSYIHQKPSKECEAHAEFVDKMKTLLQVWFHHCFISFNPFHHII